MMGAHEAGADHHADHGAGGALEHGAVSGGQLTQPGPGQTLPEAVRAFFEPRLGHDLGRVRIHTGIEAARAASSIHARAYTIGSAVVFGAGQYAPHTAGGQRLLAHELTHVVQQGAGRPLVQRQIGGPLDLNPDVCISAPGIGTVCGQGAADVCKKVSLPGCSLVCKVFDCRKPSTPTALCPPGWRAATSTGFSGQCCKGGIDSAQACCPPSRIAFKQDRCCRSGETVSDGECVASDQPVPPLPVPCPPSQMTLLGQCCFPPLVPDGLICNLPRPTPTPQPPVPTPAQSTDIHILFKFGRPNEQEPGASLSSVATSAGNASFLSLVATLKADPAARAQLVGRASPEGTDEHNMALGGRRARAVAQALSDAGIPQSQIADPPGGTLPTGCQPLSPGLATCGEAGATGDSDREVVAHVSGAGSP